MGDVSAKRHFARGGWVEGCVLGCGVGEEGEEGEEGGEIGG